MTTHDNYYYNHHRYCCYLLLLRLLGPIITITVAAATTTTAAPTTKYIDWPKSIILAKHNNSGSTWAVQRACAVTWPTLPMARHKTSNLGSPYYRVRRRAGSSNRNSSNSSPSAESDSTSLLRPTSLLSSSWLRRHREDGIWVAPHFYFHHRASRVISKYASS